MLLLKDIFVETRKAKAFERGANEAMGTKWQVSRHILATKVIGGVSS